MLDHHSADPLLRLRQWHGQRRCLQRQLQQQLWLLLMDGGGASRPLNFGLAGCFVSRLSFRAERSGVEKSVNILAGERISPLAFGSVEMTCVLGNSSINWNLKDCGGFGVFGL